MLYSKTGITQRVRSDLTDPRDGRRGIDISGQTMRNMYEEMSKGAYTVTGQASPWIKVRTPRPTTARAPAARNRRT